MNQIPTVKPHLFKYKNFYITYIFQRGTFLSRCVFLSDFQTWLRYCLGYKSHATSIENVGMRVKIQKKPVKNT